VVNKVDVGNTKALQFNQLFFKSAKTAL